MKIVCTHSKSNDECGATLVEAAMVFPILIGIAVFLLTGAQVMYNNLMLQDALRFAGRAAAVAENVSVATSSGQVARTEFTQRISRLMSISSLSYPSYFKVCTFNSDANGTQGLFLVADLTSSCAACQILSTFLRQSIKVKAVTYAEIEDKASLTTSTPSAILSTFDADGTCV